MLKQHKTKELNFYYRQAQIHATLLRVKSGHGPLTEYIVLWDYRVPSPFRFSSNSTATGELVKLGTNGQEGEVLGYCFWITLGKPALPFLTGLFEGLSSNFHLTLISLTILTCGMILMI